MDKLERHVSEYNVSLKDKFLMATFSLELIPKPNIVLAPPINLSLKLLDTYIMVLVGIVIHVEKY